MGRARSSATDGIPFKLPPMSKSGNIEPGTWSRAELIGYCRMRVARYDEERKFWRDAAWKRYCRDCYIKCATWLLENT